MKVDLNQTVKVKLTKVGIEFLEKNGYSYKMENGYITTQLWDLMEVFGSEIGMFSPPVFEHNTIEFIDIPQDGLEEKVKSLERRIDTISETLSVQNNSINTQAKTIRMMRDTFETQCDTIKTLMEKFKK